MTRACNPGLALPCNRNRNTRDSLISPQTQKHSPASCNMKGRGEKRGGWGGGGEGTVHSIHPARRALPETATAVRESHTLSPGLGRFDGAFETTLRALQQQQQQQQQGCVTLRGRGCLLCCLPHWCRVACGRAQPHQAPNRGCSCRTRRPHWQVPRHQPRQGTERRQRSCPGAEWYTCCASVEGVHMRPPLPCRKPCGRVAWSHHAHKAWNRQRR
jgi:hypothetical protein